MRRTSLLTQIPHAVTLGQDYARETPGIVPDAVQMSLSLPLILCVISEDVRSGSPAPKSRRLGTIREPVGPRWLALAPRL